MDNIEKGKHSHTIDMCMFLVKKETESAEGKKFQSYAEVEKIIDEYYRKYNGTFVNEISPFDKEMPTIEKLGETFFDDLKGIFEGTGYAMTRMEISEIPSRIYVISDFLKTGEVTADSSKSEMDMESYINHTKKYLDFYIKNADKINHSEEENNEDTVIEEVAATDEKVAKTEPEPQLKLKKWQYTAIAALVSVLLAGVVWLGLILTGNYPAGEDVYLYLTKSDYLYKQIASGNFFPDILSTWFAGYELFGASAPLSTYVLAIMQFIVGGEVINSYILYLSVCAGIGLFGWYLNGSLNKRYIIGMVLGAIWTFMPVNYNMIMLEGNLPIVFVLALVPYVIYASRRIIIEAKVSMIILQAVIMAAMLLTDFNSSVLLLVALIIVLICFGFSHKRAATTVMACVGLLLSCGIVSGWLVNVAGIEFAETFVPDVAHTNVGLVIMLMAVLCIFISSGHTRYAFVLSVVYGLLVLLASIDNATVVPMGKYIFSGKYAIIVYALFIMGMTEWKKAKRSVVVVITTLIVVCCVPNIVSVTDWQFDDNSLYDKEVQKIKDQGIGVAVDKTDARLFLADSDMKSSFPAYYASVNNKNITFNYKLDELAPAGKKVIEQMSYSVTATQYTYLFDRILEGGNDTAAIRKNDIIADTKDERLENDLQDALETFVSSKETFYYDWFYDESTNIHYEDSDFAKEVAEINADEKSFEELYKDKITSISEKRWETERSYAETTLTEAAARFGYSLLTDADDYYVFKNSQVSGMIAEAEYEGIAIGKSAAMISRLFPYFKEGGISLDDYSVEELKQYKKILLLGTEWNFNEVAEEKIKQLADSGVNIYIDMSDIPMDVYSGKTSLFGVTGHEVHFEDGYEYLLYEGKIYETSKFGNKDWDTIYLEGIENVSGYSWLGGEKLPFYGRVYNDNVHMLGFSLIYYTIEMQDRNASLMLADIMGLEINQTPDRTYVKADTDGSMSDTADESANIIIIVLCYVVTIALYTVLIVWNVKNKKKVFI